MVSKGDLESWESRLQEELDGLKYCQEQVAADTSIPAAIKTRFRDIITALNDNIYQVLAKLRQLKAEPHSATGYAKRAERVQSDYRSVLHNIEKLLKTVDANKEPRYRRDTFASQTKTPKVLRSKSATGLSPEREEKRTLGQITVELKELKDALRHIKHKVEKHTHEKYEAELKEARSENDRLWVRLHAMQEEQTRLVQLVNSLSDRFSALQPNSPEQSPEPRLLSKRVGQAEELLK